MDPYDDGSFPKLTEAETIRWRAAESDITAMSKGLNNGTAAPEEIDGTFARLSATDIDPNKHRTDLHVPPDAGEHAGAIEAILRRIPDGWGRRLRVDAGWYPLVIATDQQLARLDPRYRVHQIKEKFGTLRYYCQTGDDDPDPDRLDDMDAITDDAERASARICERCGAAGVLHRNHRVWVKTLCASCAEQLGFASYSQ